MNYDLQLSDAKHACSRALLDLQRDNKGVDVSHMACAIDNLNRMWDALTDALVRQRTERDEQILRLINELAEAKKRR